MNITNVIVVYDYAFINGGAAKVAIQSAIGLCSKYHVTYFSAVGPVCSELQNSSVEVICLGINDINTGSRVKSVIDGIWNVKAKKAFKNLMRAYNSEDTIVHIHGWVKALSSSVVQTSTMLGFKTIITLHDYFTLCPGGGFYNFQTSEICKYHGMSLRCFFCNCDKRNFAQKMWRNIRQIVQDRYVKYNKRLFFISISQLNENLVRDRVASSAFYRVSNPKGFSSENLIENIENNHTYLYVGRVSEDKGVDLFCKAITEVKGTFPEVHGVVVGDGEILNDLKNQYNSIFFEGWKNSDDVLSFMLNARALVFPSKWYEGAPLTIHEALSVGLPCIVSDCTSAVETVQHGKTGFVFKSNDIDDLIEKIIDCEKADISAISIQAKKYFKENVNDINMHIEDLSRTYENVILSWE